MGKFDWPKMDWRKSSRGDIPRRFEPAPPTPPPGRPRARGDEATDSRSSFFSNISGSRRKSGRRERPRDAGQSDISATQQSYSDSRSDASHLQAPTLTLTSPSMEDVRRHDPDDYNEADRYGSFDAAASDVDSQPPPDTGEYEASAQVSQRRASYISDASTGVERTVGSGRHSVSDAFSNVNRVLLPGYQARTRVIHDSEYEVPEDEDSMLSRLSGLALRSRAKRQGSDGRSRRWG